MFTLSLESMVKPIIKLQELVSVLKMAFWVADDNSMMTANYFFLLTLTVKLFNEQQ